MKNDFRFFQSQALFAALFALLFAVACTPSVPIPPPGNQDFAIAPAEYADLSKTALEHLTKFEFDAGAPCLPIRSSTISRMAISKPAPS